MMGENKLRKLEQKIKRIFGTETGKRLEELQEKYEKDC